MFLCEDVFLLSFSIFVSFVLEAFYVEYSVDKGDLQTALEKKIEELELAVAQYVPVIMNTSCKDYAVCTHPVLCTTLLI